MRVLLVGLMMIVGPAVALASDELPQWLVDARAREGELTKPEEVVSSDNWLRMTLPIKARKKIELSEGEYVVELDLGSTNVASCEIFQDSLDVAAVLRTVAESTFKNVIEPAQGKVEFKAIEKVDAGAVGGVPYIRTLWFYRVNDGKGARVGALKQLAAVKNGHGIYCGHVDVGYEKTFDAVTRALLETLTTTADGASPYFRELSLITLRGMRVGFSLLEMRRDQDGDTRADEISSMLVPMTEDAVKAIDSYNVDFVRPNGSLINSVRVSAENGEIDENLTLKPGEESGWVVRGKFNGKDIRAEIAGGEPETWLSANLLRRKLLAAAAPVGTQASSQFWLTEDPGRFTDKNVSVVAALDGGRFAIRESMGTLEVDYIVDQASGQATEGGMKVGPLEIEFQRVHVEGRP